MKTKEETAGRAQPAGWALRILAGLLLAAGVWAVYHPALDRVFAADQLLYFAELDGETTLASGMRLLDYSAARQYEKGDEVLYRPLLMAWLAAANAGFGRDFRSWNAAGLVLHAWVAWLLFHVLCGLHRNRLAGVVAIWFALLAANFELVTWNHLGGYLLGYGLLLAGLSAARGLARTAGDGDAGGRQAWGYALAMLGAMLVHEIAVIAGLAVLAHGVWTSRRGPAAGRWRRLAAWGAPLLAYAVLYAFHVARCERWLWVDPHAAAEPVAARVLEWPGLLWQWALHILFPERSGLVVRVFWRSGWMEPGGGAGLWWTAAGWLTGLACLRRGFTRERLRANGAFAGLLGFLILAYAGMNWIGRANAGQVAYYAYFPALFGGVLVYSLIDFARVGRGRLAIAAACGLGLAAANGARTLQTSRQVEAANADVARAHAWLEQAWRADPEATFAVDGFAPEWNPGWAMHAGYPGEGAVVGRSLLQCLYGKGYAPEGPQRRLVYPDRNPAPPEAGPG